MRRREFLKNLSAGTASLCTGHPLWGQHTGLGAFRMLALTDRLPGNARQMAAWAKENRLSGLEIGNIGGKPLHEFANPRDTAELKAAVAAANLTVPSLATSVFLCPLENEAYGQQLQQLDRCLELARSLGAPLVVVRAFLRRGGLEENWTNLTAYFREPLRRARDAGVTLGVVNDPETFIGTGRELARFIEAVGSPHLKAVWDPCAAVYDIDRPEIPYPEGYQLVKRHIALVRVRDVDRQQHSGKLQECVLGDGLVGWGQQIRALVVDQFQGPLSVSTGWHPGVRPSGATYTGDSSSEGAQKASQIYLAGLRKLEASEPPSKKPISTADFAYRELSRYLARIVREKVPVRTGSLPGGGCYLFLHGKDPTIADREQAGLASAVQDLGRDGFLIRSIDGGVAIASKQEPGLLFGTYGFLRLLGARWYFPGAEGEFLPKMDRLPYDGHQVKSLPAFHERAIIVRRIMDSYADWIEVAPKMGLNKVWLHDQEGILEAPQDVAGRGLLLGIQRHFAGEEFCTDDDRILTWEATRVKGYLPLVPSGYQSVRLRPSDTFSKDCTAGTTVADQLAKFVNRMARASREVRRDMSWDYTVYQMNWAPPPSVELDPSLTIYLHPIHRCFNHAVDDPACAINATLRYGKPNLRIPYGIRPVIEAYAKKYGGGRLGITDYWLDASFYGRAPFAPWKTRLPHYGATMQQDARFYHGLGIRSIATCVLAVEHQYLQRYTSPLLFQYGALLWNPDADLAAELRLFCANWFGNESLAAVFEWRERADPKDLTPEECRQLARRYGEKIGVVKTALASASNEAHRSRLNRLIGEYEHCVGVMKAYEKMVPVPVRLANPEQSENMGLAHFP